MSGQLDEHQGRHTLHHRARSGHIAYHDGLLQTNEVLLDSEPWPGGEAVVSHRQALLPDGMVAVRIFGLLVPNKPA